MRGLVSFVLSAVSVAFLTFFGGFSYCGSALGAKALKQSEVAAKNCVYELYLYEKSSGCEILSFNASQADEVRAQKLLRGGAVKGERLFIPASEFSSSGIIGINGINGNGADGESAKNERAKNESAKNGIVGQIIKDLNAEMIFCESGEDFYCEYYYSPRLRRFSVINGKKVNLHISYTHAGVGVSSPIAFGAY